MLARVVFCAKSTCDAATSFGLGLGLMLDADQILKEEISLFLVLF
jgi:hypothetical protein